MEINFFSVLTLLLLAVWIIQALFIVFTQKKFSWRSVLNFVASACMIVGALGVFGTDLSANAGLGFSKSFEWPIGSASGAVKLSDGTIIVPHGPTGRIQVYNQDLEFQRGWHIDAGGGVFKLVPADENSFYIYTLRNGMEYQYDADGSLLSSEQYTGSYSEVISPAFSVSIPTPFYLMVFTNPLYSWVVGLIGLLLILITGEAFTKAAKPAE
jgi:hypothetical protein